MWDTLLDYGIDAIRNVHVRTHLQRMMYHIKYRNDWHDTPIHEVDSVVYIIICLDSPDFYIGNTGLPLQQRIQQHGFTRSPMGLMVRLAGWDRIMFFPVARETTNYKRFALERHLINKFVPTLNRANILDLLLPETSSAPNRPPQQQRTNPPTPRKENNAPGEQAARHIHELKNMDDKLKAIAELKQQAHSARNQFTLKYLERYTNDVDRQRLDKAFTIAAGKVAKHDNTICLDFPIVSNYAEDVLRDALRNFPGKKKYNIDVTFKCVYLTTFGNKARNVRSIDESTAICYCNQYPAEFKKGLHVCTPLKELADRQYPDLVLPALAGAQYRAAACEQETRNRMKACSEKLFEKGDTILRTDAEKKELREWAEQLTAKLVDTLPSKTSNMAAQLDDLKSKFIITPLDKSPQTLMACCRRLYFEQLQVALEFQEIPSKDDQRKFVQTMVTAHTVLPFKKDNINSEDIPYLYLVPKVHKPQLAFRTIVGSPFNDKIKQTVNYTRRPAKILNQVCGSLLHSLFNLNKYNTNTIPGYINHYFCRQTTFSAQNTIRSHSAHLNGKMMECIDLSTCLHQYFARGYDRKRRMGIQQV